MRFGVWLFAQAGKLNPVVLRATNFDNEMKTSIGEE
jgi:hypothetical protein